MKGKKSINPVTFINSRITSTVSISLVLFLLGLIVLLALFANNLSIYVKENLSFNIVLKEDMKNAQIKNFQKKLDLSPFVKSTRYISKEEAVSQLTKELGQNPELFLGYNPLPSLIEVKLRSAYANNDSISHIEKEIRSMTSNIEDIEYRQELMQVVNKNMKNMGLIIIGLAILMLIISFALINNTIRLMIYSKRFLIHTMKLVGATHSFIRKPFILANIFSGILAALIAILLLLWLLYYLSKGVTDFIGLIDLNVLLIVFSVVLVLGIVLSVVATYFAVNKYLKMKEGDLYYV